MSLSNGRTELQDFSVTGPRAWSADAAAVHEADVRLIDGEEVEQGVGDEVGDGRVLTADELRGPFKVLRAVADDLLQRGGDLVVIAVDKGLDGGILGVGIRQEDLTVDNAGHLAVQHDDVDLIQLRHACWG